MSNNQLANNVRGELVTGITDNATSMSVSLGAYSNAYPSGIGASAPMYLTLSDPTNSMINEIVRVTAVSGSNVTTMTRAQRSTTAKAWAAGTIVSLNLHAQDVMVPGSTITAKAGTAAATSVNFGTAGTGIYGTSTSVLISLSGTLYHSFTNTGFFTSRDGYPEWRLETTGSGNATIHIRNHRDSGYASGILKFSSGRGTYASPANVQANDLIVRIAAYVWSTGTTYTDVLRIWGAASENHTSSAQGTRWDFYTTPNGSQTPAIAARIDQDKGLIGYSTIKATTGFACWNVTPPSSRPSIMGDISSYNETTLKAILTALAATGIFTDNTTT